MEIDFEWRNNVPYWIFIRYTSRFYVQQVLSLGYKTLKPKISCWLDVINNFSRGELIHFFGKVKSFSNQLGTIPNFWRKDSPSALIYLQLIGASQNKQYSMFFCWPGQQHYFALAGCENSQEIFSNWELHHCSLPVSFVHIHGAIVTTMLIHQTQHWYVSENKKFVWTAYFCGSTCGTYTVA